MNGDVEEEAPRLRPLSGGIWTLFSWLRRSERSSSDESITSVGSDRTAASFDFLAPFHYKHATTPVVLPQSPLTETYKKRLHERNLRRQHDRDLTLRRKYGLYTEEGLGYDAFSLPPARKIPKDQQGRQRRATSESTIQPRAAYVPGKRRAPLPPTFVISTSLPRNYKRKRPAPKPPVQVVQNNKENIKINETIQMNSKSVLNQQSSDINNKILERKVEKNAKKDHSTNDVKLRTEKSFLKQIFDNRKRNSAIDTSYIKVLPSISELDKQAAEIIETNKSMHSVSESVTEGSWICTNCLRKYNATIISCIYCASGKTNINRKTNIGLSSTASNTYTQTERNVPIVSNKKNENDKKEELKKMLKEMKDSLPKRPKNKEENSVGYRRSIAATETPTLRIGSTIKEDTYSADVHSSKPSELTLKIQNAKDEFLMSQPSSSKQMFPNITRTHANVSNKEIRNEIKTSNKNDISQSASSSSSKDITNQLISNNKKPSINKYTENSSGTCDKQLIETTVENKMEFKSAQSAEDHKNDVLKSNSVDKIVSEIVLSSLKEEQKTVTNRNLMGPAKITDPKTDQNIKIIDNKYENNKFNNNKIVIKSNAIPESSKNINVTQINTTNTPLYLPKEDTKVISKKPDCQKIENVSQKTEASANVSLQVSKNINLHTPLKISSLLNPLYCPKRDVQEKPKLSPINETKKFELKQEPKLCENKHMLVSNVPKLPSTNENLGSSSITSPKINNQKSESTEGLKGSQVLNTEKPVSGNINVTASSSAGDSNLDQHALRRDLINKLEQSIAKGDEKTAAEAAARLAKLKLSCSVLSFSSQIVSGPLISQNKIEIHKSDEVDKTDKITQPQEKPTTSVKTELKENAPSQETTKLKDSVISNSDKKAVEKVVLEKPLPSTSKQIPDQSIPIDVWIEDKEATRGPIRLLVLRKAVLGELKRQAEKSLGLQIRLQRWIIGKTLCSNDSTPLTSLAGPDLAAPFYLCLVETDTTKENAPPLNIDTEKTNKTIEEKDKDPSDVYTELMKLEQQALVPNSEVFECGVCIEQCAVGEGIVLRECIHTFCRECLADAVRHCTEPVVSCPAIACPGAMQEREIRALLSAEDYEKWLARSLTAAESGTRNTFHCRTRDCAGWAFCEPGVRRFPCPVCKHTNCVPCQAVHDGETCEQYQKKLREAVTAVESDQTDAGTQALLKSLIDRGEALECPECKAIITKKWGCDWIKCSACKTEICWVTKGRRWGPAGKGDTSGGCRCGVDGKRCHPSCGYCH